MYNTCILYGEYTILKQEVGRIKMQKNYKQNNSDSPFIMYLVAFIMFVLLFFTLLSFMRDKHSPLYINFDKQIIDANVRVAEDISIQENVEPPQPAKEKDFIDKALDKIDDRNYDDYKADYEKYYQAKRNKQRQELEQKQRLLKRLKEQQRLEQLKKKNPQKIAMMQDPVNRPAPSAPETKPQTPQSKIVTRTMQNSPCSPSSATIIAYFFHSNSTEPVTLIFNNPNPNFNNHGNVKLVYGDLPRGKQHILKQNMINLNQILNKPQYSYDPHTPPKRADVALKVQSGVTTSCTPYVYQSKDFYLSKTPPSLEDGYNKENYCRAHNARLADPIELIPVLLSGRFPEGMYWTSSRVHRMSHGNTNVSRSNLITTQSAMIIDYDRHALDFVSQDEFGPDFKAYSVCVFDE